MSEEVQGSTTEEVVAEVSVAASPFGSDSWSETAPEPAAQPLTESAEVRTETAVETPKTEEAVTTADNPFDVNAYVKNAFGFDNEEVAKKEIETLKQKAAKSFDLDENSKVVYDYLAEGKEDDLYSFLSNKKKIEKLINADLTDENVAAELVKYGISSKNKTLTEDEVEFLFNKKFSLPKEPVQTDAELDDEFEARKAEWKFNVANIKKELVIEAKLAQPELVKLKTELVLPKINNGAEATQQSQEDLQKLEESRNRFIQSVESDFKKFNGFEVRYKDEEVEIPVTFGYDDERKSALKEEVKNFDVDAFITKRWFSETDGAPNVTQIMEDISLLRDKEAILQKVANEVGAQMKKHYRKIKANVSVTSSGNTASLNNGNGQQAVSPFSSNAWSERPPVAV